MNTYIYTGSRTTKARNARGRGLCVYQINENGDWTIQQIVHNEENPSFQCLDSKNGYLYSVHGDLESVDSFKVNTDDGTLMYLNSIHGIGKNPVYCTISPSGDCLYVASLQGGCITVLPRNADGSLNPPVQVAKIEGKTPEAVSMAHQCIIDRTGHFLLVPTQSRNVGYAQICVFHIEADSRLTLVENYRNEAFTEPRHVAFSADNRFVYLADEKGDCIHTLAFDSDCGTLSLRGTVRSLPEQIREEAWVSGIQIDRTGHHIYVSNRTYASISVFSADLQTGALTLVQNIPAYGKTPRFLCLNQLETLLWVGNEDSDTVEQYQIEPETGILTHLKQSIFEPSPVCITEYCVSDNG